MIERFSFARAYRGRTIFKITNTILLTLAGLLILFPLLKILSDSLDKKAAVVVFRLLPARFTLEAYKTFLNSQQLYRSFLVSLFVTITGTLLSMFLTTLYAYGLTREGLPGRKFFSAIMIFTMMFQPGLIPTYLLIKSLGLLNSLWAILLPTSINAYYCILMRNFFNTISQDLLDAAAIDGCTHTCTFYKIVFPLSGPGIAAITLFHIVYCWNQFFQYIIYINNAALYNFQVVLRSMIIESDMDQYATMTEQLPEECLKNAAVIIVIIPLLLIYPVRSGGENYSKYYTELTDTLKPEIFAKIVIGEYTIEQGLSRYAEQARKMHLEDILAELNK